MNPIKRVGLLTMSVVLGGLWAASPVLAGKYVSPFVLLPPPDSPEPQAYGWVTEKKPNPNQPSLVNVRVVCRDLTPRELYYVCFKSIYSYDECYPVTTDRKGALSADVRVFPYWYVWVEDDDGAVVLIEAVY
jgi:hypothetical protein